ncbi:MAG: EamA family transporter [Proteobacteria bacterium]|nr:EamA family transporter [Pseudomonadota bacterium]
MSIFTVISSVPRAARTLDVRVILAFAAIYVLWGGTFLAIRVAVLEVPPLYASGVRFFIAGGLLYLFMRWRGEPVPSAVQWRGLAFAALSMFVVTYAALFWAEQYVASGLTSIIEATLPITTIALEVFVFRQQPFRWRTATAVVLGFAGVAFLLFRDDGPPIAVVPCIVILVAGVSWSIGAVLTRTLPRPRSAALAAGAQMLLGGAVLLVLSALTGELHAWPAISVRAGLALLYLVTAGSLVAFTAYLWLLTRMSATRVASHAYINPLVAVALGYFAAGEVVTPRMLFAAALVLTGVVLLLTPPRAARPAASIRRLDHAHTENLAR